MNAKSFLTLIQRETWEHRSLVWVPAIVAAAIVLAALVSSNISGSVQIDINGEGGEFFAQLAVDPASQAKLFSIWMGAIGTPVLFVTLIVLYFYLLDALYAERKDRSILFWKSMPVSDSATVLSKVATALVAAPVYVWLLSLVMGLFIFAIVAFKVAGTPLAPLGTFHWGAWIMLQLTVLQNLLIGAAWYAPVAGWLLLVSVWAKRAPFLWAISPALVVLLEDLVLDSSYVGRFIYYRLSHYFEMVAMGMQVDGDGSAGVIMDSIGDAYVRTSAAPLLGELHLYTGLVGAAVLIGIAIRLRRWRDDA